MEIIFYQKDLKLYSENSGYGDFAKQKDFLKCIDWIEIADNTQKRSLISKILQDTFNNYSEHFKINFKNLEVFVFFVDGVHEYCGGVSGFTPWKNSIHIYVFKYWNTKSLAHTLAHELTHIYFYRNFNLKNMLLNWIIIEGFCEKIASVLTDGFKPNYQALNHSSLPRVQNEVYTKRNSISAKVYQKYFNSGEENYVGYKIGLVLVDSVFRGINLRKDNVDKTIKYCKKIYLKNKGLIIEN